VAVSPLARLGEELLKLKEFVVLLEREQELLARADTEALLPLIDTKSALAALLAEYSASRETQLKALRLPPGRDGVQAWLEQGGSTAERKSWQELLDLAARLRALNETNGKLIALHMQSNQQAFNALMAAANRAMTYGPDGQQHTGLGGRILGKA
jgi:flagellar biosynthesis/type III secretory pathway chaperone